MTVYGNPRPAGSYLAIVLHVFCLAVVAVPAVSKAAGPVEIRNGPRPGSLEVRAKSPTALAPELIVERQRADGTFEPVRNLDLDTLHLVEACDRPHRSCIRVDASGLRPVPWSGMSCSSQCQGNCDKNVRLHGRFRFVVLSCDRRTRYAGPPFSL